MPKFTIEHQTSLDSKQSYEKVKSFLGQDEGLKKLDPKMSLKFNDASNSCDLTGSQFKANLSITQAGSGSKVAITVDLPLLLAPFKSKVTEILTAKLNKIFA